MKTNLETALEKMEDWMLLKHRDRKTRQAYRRQAERFSEWLISRRELHALSSERKIEAYLTMRAREDCAASTQNVAFHALRCFYEHGLQRPLGDISALRASRAPTIRRAPSVEETRAIIAAARPLYGYPTDLIIAWLYASGLRVSEPLNARLKDIDVEHSRFTVRDGKHGVSRVVPIPCSLLPRIVEQMKWAALIWSRDQAAQVPVPLPGRLASKYPKAQFSRAWAWLFPAKEPCRFAGFSGPVRWRIHESAVQRAFKLAVEKAGASEDLTPHHFRHAYATHLLTETRANIRDVQVAMGHRQMQTTAGYITPEIDRLPTPPALTPPGFTSCTTGAPQPRMNHRAEFSAPL